MDANTINHILLVGAILVAASIMVSSVASKIGVPILVIVLSVGMIAGVDGPGAADGLDVLVLEHVEPQALAAGAAVHLDALERDLFHGCGALGALHRAPGELVLHRQRGRTALGGAAQWQASGRV